MLQLEIRDSDIRHNIRVVREKAQVPVWGVLKYDGYGFGLVHMAGLLQAGGIGRFAVQDAAEAHLLRAAGFTEPILLLQPEAGEAALRLALKDGCILSAGSLPYIRRILDVSGKLGCRPRIHIAVDTGLGRFGFLPREYEAIRGVYRTPGLSAEGIYTHFSCPLHDKRGTLRQFRLFSGLLAALKRDGIARGTAHAAASGALFLYPGMQLDAVRVGSALTGRVGSLPAPQTGLVRAGTLLAEVCEVRRLPRGSRLGYGGEARLRRDSEIAVLPLGFRAGLLPPSFSDRLLGRHRTVTGNRKAFPILSSRGAGTVYVDVTGAGIRPGDRMEAEVNPLFTDGRIERVYR